MENKLIFWKIMSEKRKFQKKKSERRGPLIFSLSSKKWVPLPFRSFWWKGVALLFRSLFWEWRSKECRSLTHWKWPTVGLIRRTLVTGVHFRLVDKPLFVDAKKHGIKNACGCRLTQSNKQHLITLQVFHITLHHKTFGILYLSSVKSKQPGPLEFPELTTNQVL